VIWVGLEDPSGGLARLAKDVDEWVSDLGFIKEERAFRAHVTIGRVKEGQASLEDLIERYRDRECGSSTIREVVVYESRPKGGGVEYVARLRRPFGGAEPRSGETHPPR
jgi:2'-5' RNA ligase